MSPKVEKGYSYCPACSLPYIIRTAKDNFYFAGLQEALDPREPMFWNSWTERRDDQTKGAVLVAPLYILFWEKE